MAQRDPLVSEGLEPPHVEGELVEAWDNLVRVGGERVAHTRGGDETRRPNARTRSASSSSRCSSTSGTRPPRSASTPATTRAFPCSAKAPRSPSVTRKAEQTRITKGMKESAKLTKRVAAVRDEIEVARQLALLLRVRPVREVARERGAGVAVRRRIRDARAAVEQPVRARGRTTATSSRSSTTATPTSAGRSKTLSGGETFQASLALALALADQVAVDRPRAGRRSSTRSSSTRASARSTPTRSTPSPRTLETLGQRRPDGRHRHARARARRAGARALRGRRRARARRRSRGWTTDEVLRRSVGRRVRREPRDRRSTPSPRATVVVEHRAAGGGVAPLDACPRPARASTRPVRRRRAPHRRSRVDRDADGDSPGICASYAAARCAATSAPRSSTSRSRAGMFATARAAADIVDDARDVSGAHGRRRTTSTR